MKGTPPDGVDAADVDVLDSLLHEGDVKNRVKFYVGILPG